MPQVTIAYNPPLEGALSKIVYADTEVEPTAGELTVIVGAAVPLRRQTEIFNAIKFLANGIRERNLLEEQFRNLPLVTAVSIDAITANNRRTSSTFAGSTVVDTDIVIAMGLDATDHSHVLMLDTAIEAMADVLLENFKDQVA